MMLHTVLDSPYVSYAEVLLNVLTASCELCRCFLSLRKRLMTLKKSAVCDNESLCECVTGSYDEHSERVKEQPKSHTLFIPQLPVRNEGLLHFQQSASLTDAVCLVSSVLKQSGKH